ncbi:hypothetical protein M501DRAFT_987268 [Patellaria atrata CBS 101060]|uniref:Uncharacterized protein n=1 Tax=Patellaria atrata CBS 101060 TaxID=1346257 RepID=A0A9P4VQH9_9PEZI|nr:hypothetical protein M501DRAFT_987268 [Patellaria atrata CBS 101060]
MPSPNFHPLLSRAKRAISNRPRPSTSGHSPTFPEETKQERYYGCKCPESPTINDLKEDLVGRTDTFERQSSFASNLVDELSRITPEEMTTTIARSAENNDVIMSDSPPSIFSTPEVFDQVSSKKATSTSSSPTSPRYYHRLTPNRRAIRAQMASYVAPADYSVTPHMKHHPVGLQRTRSIRRSTSRGSQKGKIGLKLKYNTVRVTKCISLPKNNHIVSHWQSMVREASLNADSPTRALIQDGLKSPRVIALKSEFIDFGSRTLPKTPEIFSSPTELLNFSISTQSTTLNFPQSTPTTPRANQDPLHSFYLSPGHSHTQSHNFGYNFPLTPIATSLDTLAVIASDSPISPHRTPRASIHPPISRSTSIHLHSGSVLTVISPEDSPFQRSTYLPGPIRLQPPYAPGGVVSLATWKETLTLDGEGAVRARRQSEDATIEGLVKYFEGLGVERTASVGSTDQFWKNGRRSRRALARSVTWIEGIGESGEPPEKPLPALPDTPRTPGTPWRISDSGRGLGEERASTDPGEGARVFERPRRPSSATSTMTGGTNRSSIRGIGVRRGSRLKEL